MKCEIHKATFLDYCPWCRCKELEAHNKLLLADADASPAIIAGYRDYNAKLLSQLARCEAINEGLRTDRRVLKARVEELENIIKLTGGLAQETMEALKD